LAGTVRATKYLAADHKKVQSKSAMPSQVNRAMSANGAGAGDDSVMLIEDEKMSRAAAFVSDWSRDRCDGTPGNVALP